LRSNPYLNANESEEIKKLIAHPAAKAGGVQEIDAVSADATVEAARDESEVREEPADEAGEVAAETISAYFSEHAAEIAAEEGKPFEAVGVMFYSDEPEPAPVAEDTLAAPVAAAQSAPTPAAGGAAAAVAARPAQAKAAAKKTAKPEGKRENSLQKINALDIRGRIQLALKGNKEERSLLIRDGTKVVALAVLEAPKLSDGEVQRFASQKNVLESVLRAIPLKRRFMKDYIVVRNLVANPRTPLDLGLGLMKNLLTQDLKNLSANKEVSDTIRKLALKMFKQKLEAANKK
jgi:hypothetical protein